MNRLMAPARLMIVSDLDHTMVDHHDTENTSLLRFNALWETHYRDNSLLVFSTGRSPVLYKNLRTEKPMLTPDITILSVGTEITYGNSMVPDEGWVKILDQNWDRNVIVEETSKFSELKLQPETEQRVHKVSFYVEKDKAQNLIPVLSGILKKRGLDVKIIYSGGIDLDVLPEGAGKGQALAYLHRQFAAKDQLPNSTLVCGDSGNDAELFSIPNVYGVMVSNAQEELLQWHAQNAKSNPKIIHASKRCAAGIIEAIGHFNLGPSSSPRDCADLLTYLHENPTANCALVVLFLFYEKWRRSEVDKSSLHMNSLKADCDPLGVLIHPSGAEIRLVDAVGKVANTHGDQKGKQFRVWVDQVSSTKISSDAWLVRLKKWESIGDHRVGCVLSAVIQFEEGSNINPKYLHIHETWLEDYNSKQPESWLF